MTGQQPVSGTRLDALLRRALTLLEQTATHAYCHDSSERRSVDAFIETVLSELDETNPGV